MDLFRIFIFQTYAIDRDGIDSAASATAYLCGVKANYYTAGVGGNVYYKDCASYENGKHNVDSVLIDAYKQGKWILYTYRGTSVFHTHVKWLFD